MSTQNSSRLQRNYEDNDLLSVPEVLEVLSVNSGCEVPDRALSDIARIKQLKRERPSPRAVLYHYDEIKSIIVAAGRGRPQHATASPNAQRQRKLREKLRESLD